MPWHLRMLEIVFYVVQFIILLVVYYAANAQGFTGALGFCILYILFLYITMAICIALVPARHRKYFYDHSPDNPEGCRNIFTYFADTYNSLRNKLK